MESPRFGYTRSMLRIIRFVQYLFRCVLAVDSSYLARLFTPAGDAINLRNRVGRESREGEASLVSNRYGERGSERNRER